MTERLFDPGPPPPSTTDCPLCEYAVEVRANGRLRRHRVSLRLADGQGGVIFLCGVDCQGGGMTVAAARALAEQEPAEL